MRILCAVSVCLWWAASSAAAAEPAAEPPAELARKAGHFFRTYCHRCHGQDGANEGGFNYVVDLARLTARRKVVPGNAGKSRLFRRLIDAGDPMPPVEEKIRPGKDDIALIKTWIESGAPAAEAPAAREYVTLARMLELIAADLEALPPRDRRFARYFTLTHLANAGLSEEELQSYRHALCKLVNSLSWGRRVVRPRAVDAGRTIFRIDLRDYHWNEQVWETILARNPYGVLLATAAGRACASASHCRLPHVRADWFVAAAARPPLYHDILQLPDTERALEKMLRLDLAENIRLERVARAGFNGSGVSRNNRLIERHEAGATVYWRSYDFGGNVGRQNLFAHPLGPAAENHAFHADGGEIILTLPNGLQAYLLVDARGRRIDKGPTAIVSDPRRPDRAVENGISCMSCHARGIIAKADQVRPHVLNNPSAFPAGVVDAVRSLYPPAEALTIVMRDDARRFQEAVALTGAPLTATEPVVALALRFEAEMDLTLAAAEAGVPARDFLGALKRVPALAGRLGPLSNTHAREKEYAAAIQAFSDAIALVPENPLAFHNRAAALYERGDLERAIADYSQALKLGPPSPVTLNNRGLAYLDREDHDRALADFDRALGLDPAFAIAFNNLGLAYLGKEQFPRALADFSAAIRLDPLFARAFFNRSIVLEELGRSAEARADRARAVQLDPGLEDK
jgi:tetratricopeptide (TPR) repeat protein